MKTSYKSKIVGVTFEGRQGIIAMLKGDEPLRVRREPDNKYDPLAVAVDAMIAETWNPIGYIAKDKNKEIAATLDGNNPVSIGVASITGGGDKSYGVNVAIEYDKMDSTSTRAVESTKAEPDTVLKAQNVNYSDMLLQSLEGLGLIPTEYQKYTSKLIGKTTTVKVVNGHVRLEGYMGGSSFHKRFYEELDTSVAADRVIGAHYKNSTEEHKALIKSSLIDMWSTSGDVSSNFGNAVHAAMENYDKYQMLGDKIKKVKKYKTKPTEIGPNKALSSNPFLAKIVTDFHDKFGGDYVRLNEQFIWLHEYPGDSNDYKGLCGSIDRVKVIDAKKKIVRIQDFKTDGDLHGTDYQLTSSPFYPDTQGDTPKMGKTRLDKHWLQLSFYAYILNKYGYKVEGLDVYWLNPEKLCKGENAWEEYSRAPINIEKGF